VSKSTFAVSGSHIGKSMAFKRFFLPTESEQENLGIERANFVSLVGAAIEAGAALPDESEHSSEKFDSVAWTETCGKGARARLRTVLGEDMDPVTYLYGSNMSHFSLHGVYAHGDGEFGSSRREVGGLKVRDVERIFQEELGDLKEYSPWMDTHVGWYDNDLASYARRLSDHGVPVLALRWPSADQGRSFYSLIVHAPDTQEVYEIISASAPELPREVTLKEFPTTRHAFEPDELRLLMDSSGPTQLHISRSHYDLDAVKAHYKDYFRLDPVHEMRDAGTGVGFVSFWHQALGASAEADAIRVQIIYWNWPDQSTVVAHTTTWLERRLEQLNSQYMTSYTSCWPIWADNHYTVIQVPGDYFNMVRNTYSSQGIGYMLFQKSGFIFTSYFPLPGGTYVELQPIQNDAPAADEDVPEWDGSYCYSFTCPE
jgi:hypothetical protein